MSEPEPLATVFRAIDAIYSEDVTDEDREQISDINLEEPGTIPLDRAIAAIKVVAEDFSRIQALRLAYQNLRHFEPTIDDKIFLLYIEYREYANLWESGEARTAIMRAASFFETFLIEECNLSQDTKLYWAIRSASDEGFLTFEEEKALQFLREVRNDCGHNAWLQTEYHQEIIMNAAFTAIVVTNSIRARIMNERLAEIGESRVDRDSSNLSSIVQSIENRYNWEWEEDNRRYEPNSQWSPPEDENPYFDI